MAGALELAGALRVVLLHGFVPQTGMVFDLWKAASAAGGVQSVSLPELPVGLFWHTGAMLATGELRVGLAAEDYASYAGFYGLIADPTEDEDGDGQANLIEFATGQLLRVVPWRRRGHC